MVFDYQSKKILEEVQFNQMESISSPLVNQRMVVIDTKKGAINILTPSPVILFNFFISFKFNWFDLKEDATELSTEISKYSGLGAIDQNLIMDEVLVGENTIRKREVGFLKVDIFKASELEANDLGFSFTFSLS